MNANLPFNYSIRRSQRATKVRIVVRPDKVEVVAPPKTAEKKLHQFVESKQQWIQVALAKMAEKKDVHKSNVPVYFGEGAEVPYLGRTYKLTHKLTKLKRLKVEFAEEFIAHVPESMQDHERHDAIKAALMAWMKKQAVHYVETCVNRHAERHRLIPRSINIRTQKSRWGSCGINNDIQINHLLVMAPPEVLEYVVVHELCHIKVKNHSGHFWALVAELMPTYKLQRQWLKQHGGSLMAFLSD